MFGTFYLVEKNKKYYALKIEKCLLKNIKNKQSQLYNEINFAKKLGNKYPDLFLALYEYDFIEDCKHDQKYAYDIEHLQDKQKRWLMKLRESNYCVRRIYSLVDTTLDDIKNKLNLQQRYSAIIQIANVVMEISFTKSPCQCYEN